MDRFTVRSFLLIFHLFLCLELVHVVQGKHSPLNPHARRQYDTGELLINATAESHNSEFYKFVTRPDITAPRWNVTVYDRDALSPGYWFVSTYEYVEQIESDNRAWLGPHIYDERGELVWSGVPLFEGYNLKDFRVSNIDGESMLTGAYLHDHGDVVVNSNYELLKTIQVGDGNATFLGMHDFNTVQDGTRALAMTVNVESALEQESENFLQQEHCEVLYPGFKEFDTATWEETFSWASRGHVHLNESYFVHCSSGYWDYMHGNSINKFPDGDYLISGRLTDAIYKISGEDGSIVWRFGGKDSDFVFSDHFSGQHDARVLDHNATHTVISFLDNAIRPGEPHTTNDQSRGMIISLRTDTKPMTAVVLQRYNHPHGDYAPGRGNFQILDNGNAFLGWWIRSLISEHAPDGTLLMEASLLPNLKSYRSYKFPWTGRPVQRPDVHSEAVVVVEDGHAGEQVIRTTVHVSWNGATDVSSWNLYETTANGNSKKLIASIPRQGFESALAYNGFLSHVILEGIDHNATALGQSVVVKTVLSAPLQEFINVGNVIQRPNSSGNRSGTVPWLAEVPAAPGNSFVAFVGGMFTCVLVAWVLRALRHLWNRNGRLLLHRRKGRRESQPYAPIRVVDEDE